MQTQRLRAGKSKQQLDKILKFRERDLKKIEKSNSEIQNIQPIEYFEKFEEMRGQRNFKKLLVQTLNQLSSPNEKDILLVYTAEKNFLKTTQIDQNGTL